MKAREYAKELFDRFYLICQEYTEEIQCSIQAKQCALIANEIERLAKIDAYESMYEFQPDIASQACIYETKFHHEVKNILKEM